VPKQLNNGRITSALQAAFGFKGRYVPMLDEVIVPVYQISDPVPSEPQASFGRRLIATGAAAAFTAIKFTNPVNSGVLAMVTSASAGVAPESPGPGNAVGLSLIITDSVPLGSTDGLSAVARDTRVSSGSSKMGMSFTQTGLDVNTISAIITIFLITDSVLAQVVGGSGADQPRLPPLVIRPGRGFEVILHGASAQDLPLLLNVAWAEVPLGGPATPRGF